MTYENFDYYERTIGVHAHCTSNTKANKFVPIYNQDPNKTFIPIDWNKLYGAPSRDRT